MALGLFSLSVPAAPLLTLPPFSTNQPFSKGPSFVAHLSSFNEKITQSSQKRVKCFRIAASLDKDRQGTGNELKYASSSLALSRRTALKQALLAVISSAAGQELLQQGRTISAEAAVEEKPAAEAPAETLDKVFQNPSSGVTFRFPGSMTLAINRKVGTDKGKEVSETVGLVGNFTNFDTVSVIRYPTGGLLASATPEDVSNLLIPGGNISTEYVSSKKQEPSGPQEGPQYFYEYVTDVCRGEVIEGLEGKKECVKGDLVLQTIKRHHLARVIPYQGYFYMMLASSTTDRWELTKATFQQMISSLQIAKG